MTSDLDHVLSCSLLSLQQRQEKILSGVVAGRKTYQKKHKATQKPNQDGARTGARISPHL